MNEVVMENGLKHVWLLIAIIDIFMIIKLKDVSRIFA